MKTQTTVADDEGVDEAIDIEFLIVDLLLVAVISAPLVVVG